MKRFALILFLVHFSAAATAQQGGLSYNYLQGSFGQVDVDDAGIDVDGDGLGISGLFAIDQNFHLFGEYQTADLDFGVDLNTWEFGVGYHSSMSPNLDVIGNLGYFNVELDTPGFGSPDDGGLLVGLGLRGKVSSAVELYGGLDYVDFDDSDGETRAHAGFLLGLTPTFGLGLKLSLWDDFNIYQLNARIEFD